MGNVTNHKDDILPHINAPDSVAARVAAVKGCITVLDVIQVCWQLSTNDVKITAELQTPLGNVSLGSVDLNASHPSATLGGHVDSFKAEVTISFDFNSHTLTIEAKACAPLVGCKSGSTSVHL